MVNAYREKNADVVLGPVRAEYGPDCPDWMRKTDLHSTRPVWVKGQIITGYTCNVLMNTSAKSVAGLRFRHDLGRTGGEDTVFFSTIHKAGGHIAYAPDALVTEIVPTDRANFMWLVKRRYRFGQTHGLLLLEASGFGLLHRIRPLANAISKACICFTFAILNFGRPSRRRFWLLRGSLHSGVISRLLGRKLLEPYS
jgi:succinoglycan biosynthesis protein ExoM